MNKLNKKEVAVSIACVVLLTMSFCAIGGNSHQIAKSLICKSNLANIGKAALAYTEDNDGQFSDAMDWLHLSSHTIAQLGLPPVSPYWYGRWHNEQENNINRPELVGQLWPYIGGYKVLLCDSFNALVDDSNHTHGAHEPFVPVVPQYSYAQNFFIGDASSFGNGVYSSWVSEYDAPRVSNVKRPPSGVFMFSEENPWVINQSFGYEYNWSNNSLNDTALISFYANPYNVCDAFATYHKTPDKTRKAPAEGYANAVFVDGHVEEVLNWDTDNPQTKAEPRNLLKLSDPIGWYDQIYPY